MKNSEKGDLYGSESDGTFAMKSRGFTNTALQFSALSHSTGHREVEWLVGRDCGTTVVCAFERRGIKCGSAADEREAGVVDKPSEWAFSILPIPWQVGGPEEAFRERVSPTGIRPGYVHARARNTCDSRF